MQQLPQERLIIAVAAVAAIEEALAHTVKYTKDRQAFGKPVFNFQNTKFKLAEMATTAKIARVFLDDCIAKHMRGELDVPTASMAKWWTTQMQCDVADECLQFFGGYGYMQEYPISRMYTDSRIQKIYGGTNEIMKEIISPLPLSRRHFAIVRASRASKTVTCSRSVGHVRQPPARTVRGDSSAQSTAATEPAAQTFEVKQPGHRRGASARFPVHTADDVAARVARRREAQTWWAGLGFDGRQEAHAALGALAGPRLRRALRHSASARPASPRPTCSSSCSPGSRTSAGPPPTPSGCWASGASRPAWPWSTSTPACRYEPLGVIGVITPVERAGLHRVLRHGLRAGRRQRRRREAQRAQLRPPACSASSRSTRPTRRARGPGRLDHRLRRHRFGAVPLGRRQARRSPARCRPAGG